MDSDGDSVDELLKEVGDEGAGADEELTSAASLEAARARLNKTVTAAKRLRPSGDATRTPKRVAAFLRTVTDINRRWDAVQVGFYKDSGAKNEADDALELARARADDLGAQLEKARADVARAETVQETADTRLKCVRQARAHARRLRLTPPAISLSGIDAP